MNNFPLIMYNPKPYNRGFLNFITKSNSPPPPEEKITYNCDELQKQIEKCDKQHYTYQSFKDIEKCTFINQLYNTLCKK